jgi:hypothetical protein
MKGHEMDELLTMSKRELSRLEVMQRIKDKRLTQKEAAQLLGPVVYSSDAKYAF